MKSMIARDKFDRMLHELFRQRPMSFDTLCEIAREELSKLVRDWCYRDKALGLQEAEDVMTDIQIRLIQTAVSGFFLRGGTEAVNDDPVGFLKWMTAVAKNVKNDAASRARRQKGMLSAVDPETVCDEEAFADKICLSDEKTERLSLAFEIALTADTKVCKVLTWVAQNLFLYTLDGKSGQKPVDAVLSAFQERSLFEMFSEILRASEQIPWLCISESQRERIFCQLCLPYENDTERRMGDVCYSEYFMKKGGKATISDWVNRMNNRIVRVMKNGSFDS